MSTLSETSQANLGWVYPSTFAGSTDRYHSEIVAILTVDGTPSLQEIATTSLPVTITLVDIVITVEGSPELQTWRLDSGAANVLDSGQIAPADYNASTNSKHWTRVG